MLAGKYLELYIDFYNEVNIPNIGTLYKNKASAKVFGKILKPFNYVYTLTEEKSDDFSHYALFVSQLELLDFETTLKQLQKDFEYWKSTLVEGNSVIIKNIGSLHYFKNEISLFTKTKELDNYGYPSFNI